jgi:hypothetical protein
LAKAKYFERLIYYDSQHSKNLEVESEVATLVNWTYSNRRKSKTRDEYGKIIPLL